MRRAKAVLRSTGVFMLVLVLGFYLSSLAGAAVPQGHFTDVKPVLTSGDFSDYTVAVTADDLTAFFTNDGTRGGEGGEDIWMATRTDPDAAFENIVNLGSDVNSSGNDNVGSVSPDGLTLYFGSNRAGDFDLYQATRASVDQSFGNVTSLGSGVNTASTVENSPSVSADGLVMVYHSRPDVDPEVERDIWLATRDSTAEQFANAAPLGAAVNEYSESWPAISADGLTLMWSDWTEFPPRPGGNGFFDIWVSLRESRENDFETVANLNDVWPGTTVNGPFADGSPYLSADWPAYGSKLYFASNSLTLALVADLFQATWVPEPTTAGLLLVGIAFLSVQHRRR